ncbi:MAG: hypothetical protein AAB300_03640 [Nitrospirota bacterium]
MQDNKTQLIAQDLADGQFAQVGGALNQVNNSMMARVIIIHPRVLA